MKKIMLQGMLYITDRNIYFYSPFNNQTIIGYGTKVTINYLQLNEIKKVDSLLVFKTGIKLNLKSGQDIQFNNIALRDTCYAQILRQMTQEDLLTEAQ